METSTKIIVLASSSRDGGAVRTEENDSFHNKVCGINLTIIARTVDIDSLNPSAGPLRIMQFSKLSNNCRVRGMIV